jgi:hypothetical protein
MNRPQGSAADAILEATERSAVAFLAIAPEVAARRPAPGKWSIKEIVGHLIDSAFNNHQRFVRAQWTTDLVLTGYDQDAWVASQRYEDAPWPDLVLLWRDLNRHLARTVAAIPSTVRELERQPHNLDRMAFRPVPADEAVTLDYFIHDYVDHMKHHLRQIEDLIKVAR